MRRHSWQPTESHKGTEPVERCAYCHTERVRDTSTKSLYEYRGGNAKPPGRGEKVMPSEWCAYVAGAIPRCVERAP